MNSVLHRKVSAFAFAAAIYHLSATKMKTPENQLEEEKVYREFPLVVQT